MANCAKCGTALAEGAVFCGSCGASVTTGGAPAPASAPPAGAATSSGLTSNVAGAPSTTGWSGLTPNVAGALAYFMCLFAIVFLLLEPFKKDRFVRFHAFQSLFFVFAWIVLVVGMMIVSFIIAQIPLIGGFIALLLWPVICLGGFASWVFLMYKAYNNQKFMMPVIGKLAEQQASR